MEKQWVQEMFDREFSRLQPILEQLDNNPNAIININGHKCKKERSGTYNIGLHGEKDQIAMISISPDLTGKRYDGKQYHSKNMMFFGENIFPFGNISVSSIDDDSRVVTAGLNDLDKSRSKNTIIENAMNIHYVDPEAEKELRQAIHSVLLMFNDLGIELTPAENMEMLRAKKQLLEEQLAQINKELAEKEAQQK